MSRFDLYRGNGYSDYLLDVQADHHYYLDSRMVIPVVSASKMSLPNPRLHVRLEIEGNVCYAVTNMMGAVPSQTLSKPIGNASNQDYEITAAIDFLLQGF